MSLEKFFETRRKTVELEGGIPAVVRTIDTREAFIAAGIVPGMQNIGQEQSVKVERELVRIALVSLDGEADPIGRGLIQIEDLSPDDREKILGVVYDKLKTRGTAADEGGVPLAPTGSPEG